MLTIVIARSKNGVIGNNGTLPWHNKNDQRWFKEQTIGHVVIMGRKTWKSLYKKPLPGRTNIVVSKTFGVSSYIRSHSGALWVSSLLDAIDLAQTINTNDD